jgi:hypothetical protein
MKLIATICMPALMLGAAAFVTPALAQGAANPSASGNAAAAAPAQPAQDANTAAVPAQSNQATRNTTSSQTAMSADGASSANSQMAMNSIGNAGDLSSVPDNQHKYSRAKKSADNRSEGQTTKELNQKEASLSGASSTASAQ